jgi:hypothetical protein
VEEVIICIGPERCLAHSFVSQLKFDHSRMQGEPDILTGWSFIGTLRSLKDRFPSVTTAANAQWAAERHIAIRSIRLCAFAAQEPAQKQSRRHRVSERA